MTDSPLLDRYNDGLIAPPPAQNSAPERLAYPTWRPTAAQVETARKNLRRDLAILALILFACLLLAALLLGWRP